MQSIELDAEQKEDINKRIEEFKKEYAILMDKYQVDFVSYPMYVPTERGTFETFQAVTIADKKYAPVPSPLAKD